MIPTSHHHTAAYARAVHRDKEVEPHWSLRVACWILGHQPGRMVVIGHYCGMDWYGRQCRRCGKCP